MVLRVMISWLIMGMGKEDILNWWNVSKTLNFALVFVHALFHCVLQRTLTHFAKVKKNQGTQPVVGEVMKITLKYDAIALCKVGFLVVLVIWQHISLVRNLGK